MKYYFSSDWHLSHKNIIKFDNRPFFTIKEHDDWIMKMVMKTLEPGDYLYYLGDFSFCNKNQTETFLQTLQSSGAILNFIKGNHDDRHTVKLYETYGNYLGEQKKIKVNEQEIILNHFKMCIWDKSHVNAWHLYGHSHGRAEHIKMGKSMDVGINVDNRYKLWEFDEITEKMKLKSKQIIDHHGETGRE